MALTNVLTPTKFLAYQEAFYCEVSQSPLRCKIKRAVVTERNDFSSFVGNNEVTHIEKEIPIFWERQLSPINRSKFGIEQSRDTTLYIAPKSLEKVFGKFKFDTEELTIEFNGKQWLVDKFDYLSPLFNSCIAIEVHLQSATKGGQ